jgi:LysM repeat protein
MLRLHRIVLVTCLSISMGVSALVTPVAAAGSGATLMSKYTVVNGDYLSGIAMKLHVTLKDLLAVNHMVTSSLLLPGMKLAVPKSASTSKVAKAGRATATAAPASHTYTVVNGDYLTGIAQQLGVSTRDLLRANSLSLNSLIWPGMKLNVPAGGRVPASAAVPPAVGPTGGTTLYTVVDGDFLSGIAQRLGVPLRSLLTVNQMTTSSFIYPGLRLKVPAGAKAPAAPSAAATSAATPAATAGVTAVIAFARAQLGKPYKYNTAGPTTFDCSGLTLAAFDVIGITLPHYSGAQMSFGTVVDWTTEAIRPGDLVFLESAPGTGIVNHVGIATSATTWIQAPRSGDVVREGRISTTRVIGVRRLVNG